MSKVILIVTIIAYSMVVSQSFMYMFSLKNTQMALNGSAYTEVRQLIDANMMAVFKYVMYAALLSSLLWVITNLKTPTRLSFITGVIAFVALLIDAILTLKGNVPLNEIINSWAPADYPENWKEIRNQWFRVLEYRQVANLTGFVSLLIGVVFGGKGN